MNRDSSGARLVTGAFDRDVEAPVWSSDGKGVFFSTSDRGNGKIAYATLDGKVDHSPQEIVLTLLPGAECIAEETYPHGKKAGQRRWYFVDHDWKLARYTWKTNRLLLIFEPQHYYSIILFWNHASHEFLCYYVNFQLPFQRGEKAVDTLDLDLDLIIHPDFSYEWKDRTITGRRSSTGSSHRNGPGRSSLPAEHVMERLEDRQYPFDGSWLDWRPDPDWRPPRLPENWEKI